jgi:hypothetical protein
VARRTPGSTGQDIARLFPDCPEALDNAAALAGVVAAGHPQGRVILPRATVRRHSPSCEEPSELARDVVMVAKRCRRSFDNGSARAGDHRLKGFADYFLVVRHRVARAHALRSRQRRELDRELLPQSHARGPAGAGARVRQFLNPGQGSARCESRLPWDERDAALEFVFPVDGGRSAMVANHVTFQRRAAGRWPSLWAKPPRSRGDKRMPWSGRSLPDPGDACNSLARPGRAWPNRRQPKRS